MEEKNNKSLKISVLAFILIVLCSYSFYEYRNEIFHSVLSRYFYSKKSPKIATLYFSKNKVFVKHSNREDWIQVSNKFEFHPFDSIRVGEGSKAILHFKDLEEVLLNEKTVVVLKPYKREDSVPSLDLIRGDVVVFRGEINVSSKAGNFHLGKQKVLSGSVTTTNMRVEDLIFKAPSLLYPKNNDKIFFSGNKANVDFNWSKILAADYYSIRLAKDSEFNTKVITLSSDTNSIPVNKFSEEGEYYWKVEARHTKMKKYASSKPSKFLLIKKILAVSPLNKTVLMSPKAGELEFKWGKVSDVDIYRLMISKDKEFKKLILNKLYKTNEATINTKFTEGVYYWKVIVRHPILQERYHSDLFEFTLKTAKKENKGKK